MTSATPTATAVQEPLPAGPWLAWHLHLASEARSLQDRVVRDVVLPVVREADRPWFFLRYWQGGPHVRLRLRDLDDAGAGSVEQELAERLAGAGQLRAGEAELTAADHARAAGRLLGAGEPGAAADQVLLPPGVYVRPYEPEVERYGGAPLLPDAEHLFGVSSELCAHALAGAPPSTGARAGLALRAAVVAAAALEPGPEREAFAALGLEAWRAFIGRLGAAEPELDRLCNPRGGPGGEGGPAVAWDELVPTDGPLAPLGRAMRQHVARARALTAQEPGRLLFSHVHMLHNRLGLNPTEEVQTYARLVRLVRPADAG